MLRIGGTGFGGPLVTINMMKDAFVRKLSWISEKEFLERMGMVKLLPGPVSSLMAINLGRKFFGIWGSLIGLTLFILPSFLIVLLWDVGESYFSHQVSSELSTSILWSFRMYIVAAILMASYKLLRDTWNSFKFKRRWRIAMVFCTVVLAFVAIDYGRPETEVLLLAAVLALAFHKIIPDRHRFYSFTMLSVFFLFFTASLIVFGTGYMLFPYIERMLISKGLISRESFEAGILLGNLSPGPVVIGATYYGWRLAGLGGAIGATLGIFSGPFFLMNLIYKTLEKWRSKVIIQHLSLSIIPAVVVVLLRFNWGLFTAESVDGLKIAVFVGYLFILYFFNHFAWHVLAIIAVTGIKIMMSQN
jgi:chromate transporter